MKDRKNIKDLRKPSDVLKHLLARSIEKPISFATIIGAILLIASVVVTFLPLFYPNLAKVLKDNKDITDFAKLIINTWPSFFISIIIYILLEDKIVRPNDIPVQRTRNAKQLLKLFGDEDQTNRCLWILDTSINTLYEDEKNFEKNIKSAIKNVQPIFDAKNSHDGGVRILLLHPDTYAAEQRSKDLSNSTRTFLHEMKDGLGKLYFFLEDYLHNNPDHKNKIEVRLFKKTPFMIYARWNFFGSFGILLPDKPAQEGTFDIHADLELGRSLNSNFISLWEDSETIQLNEYFLVNISLDGSPRFSCYWGGSTEDREFPKYLFSPNSDSTTFLDRVVKYNRGVRDTYDSEKLPGNKYAKFKQFVIEHDRKFLKVTLKPYSLEKNEETDSQLDEFEYAVQQISKTIGAANVAKLNLRSCKIYELAYFHEKHRIRLDRMEDIQKRIARNGYVFVSHKHYDFQLDDKSMRYLTSLKNGFKYVIEDENDTRAIESLQSKLRTTGRKLTFDPLPRKRLFARYDCQLKGVEPIDIMRTQQSICSGIFKASYRDKTTGIKYESSPIENRPLPSLSDEIAKYENIVLNAVERNAELEQYENALEGLKDLDIMIRSTIEADLLLFLGEEKFLYSFDQYDVEVHLLRCHVDISHPIAYPTLQELQTVNFDFQAIHLVNRSGISGGINHVIYSEKILGSDGAYFSLQETADSLFFVGNAQIPIAEDKSVDVSLNQYATEIILLNGKSKGNRDILVLNFRKK